MMVRVRASREVGTQVTTYRFYKSIRKECQGEIWESAHFGPVFMMLLAKGEACICLELINVCV